MKSFPNYRQPDQMDCGPTCLRMIAKYYGKNFSLRRLREISGINRDGVSLLGISEAAEKIGFRTTGVRINIDELNNVELPIILHWNQNHFIVLFKITRWRNKHTYQVADPAKGHISYTEKEFNERWLSTKNRGLYEGIILAIAPTPEFYLVEEDRKNGMSLNYLIGYLRPYKGLLFQLFCGLGIGSLMQLILPFLAQSVVDIGINTKNLSFIYIILIAQTMLFLGRNSVEFIRSWIFLHMSTRINISILTDFIIKIMKLPMSFFDTKMTGDIMQRMDDQARIQGFLTGPTLNIVFSMFNLLVFSFVMIWYDKSIFSIILISSIVYGLWVLAFLKKRRDLDFKRFDISAKNQGVVYQLIGGMQEIKLHNCEQQKRWEWERLQAGLFRFSIKTLSLGQIQQAGAMFINEGKNIIITFIVARSVVEGVLTLGGMMAVQYIVGQLNSPIEQFLGFIQQFQDAKISLERLNEIHELDDEEPPEQTFMNKLPNDKSITFNNLTFTYPGAGNDPILKNISLKIPEGKTTAIVGMSGSGKTTILKLLLRYYISQTGNINIGQTPLSNIGFRFWRGKCGIVMQENFIFSDSIANNIAISDEFPDIDRLKYAIDMANIKEFINDLPLGLNTKIGADGNGISQGQKQRIMIARAIYKNPEFIFFDEATNSLDANNEKVIMENLESFFEGRTVIIVAHRLSTVKNADNIIVLDKGEIVEQGSHTELTKKKGEYYHLVKNQLELGYS